jgi:hypothetical protein
MVNGQSASLELGKRGRLAVISPPPNGRPSSAHWLITSRPDQITSIPSRHRHTHDGPAFIHPTSWKGTSPKFVSTILHDLPHRGTKTPFIPGLMYGFQKRSSLLKNSSVPFSDPLQRPRTSVYGGFRPVWVVFESVLEPPTNPTATFSTAWFVFDTLYFRRRELRACY